MEPISFGWRIRKGKVLASSRFKILGEGEKFTGKVNFTEDEASGKKADD